MLLFILLTALRVGYKRSLKSKILEMVWIII